MMPVFTVRRSPVFRWEKTSMKFELLLGLITALNLAYNATVLWFGLETNSEMKCPIFSELMLARLVASQWLIVVVMLFSNKGIPMPLFGFLSLLATNGTAVLFTMASARIHTGRAIADTYFFALLLGLVISLVHLTVYGILILKDLNRSKIRPWIPANTSVVEATISRAVDRKNITTKMVMAWV